MAESFEGRPRIIMPLPPVPAKPETVESKMRRVALKLVASAAKDQWQEVAPGSVRARELRCSCPMSWSLQKDDFIFVLDHHREGVLRSSLDTPDVLRLRLFKACDGWRRHVAPYEIEECEIRGGPELRELHQGVQRRMAVVGALIEELIQHLENL